MAAVSILSVLFVRRYKSLTVTEFDQDCREICIQNHRHVIEISTLTTNENTGPVSSVHTHTQIKIQDRYPHQNVGMVVVRQGWVFCACVRALRWRYFRNVSDSNVRYEQPLMPITCQYTAHRLCRVRM